MRRCLVVVLFSLLMVAEAFAAPAGQAVSGGHLKIDELSELTQGGRVTLVGFAWDGPAQLFANGFAAAGLAAAKAGDRSFSVAAEGSTALCEGLGKIGTDKKTLEQGRLSFRSADGPLKALTLGGISVAAVDCSTTPWTAELRAANLEEASVRVKNKDRKKANRKTKEG